MAAQEQPEEEVSSPSGAMPEEIGPVGFESLEPIPEQPASGKVSTPISMAEQPKAVAMDLAARIEAALAEPDALLDMEGDRNDRLAEEQLLPDVDYLVEESALPELEPIPVEEMAGIEPMDGEKLSTLETIAVQGMMEAERAASGERPAFIFPASEQEPGEEEMRDEDFERAFLSPSEGPLQPLEAPELPPVDQEMLDTGRATTADHFAIWDFTGDLDQLVPPAIQEESFERRPSQTMRSEPAGMSNRSTWPREPSRSDAAGQVGQTVVGRPLDEKNRTAERREPQTSQPERSEVTSTSPGRPSPAIKAQQQEAGAKEVTPPPVFSRERPSSGMTEAAPGPSPLFEETPPPTTGKRGRSFFYNEEGVSREEAITPVGLPVVYDLAKPIEDSGPEQNQEDTEQPALGSEGEKRFSRSGSGVQPAPGGGEEQTTRSGERYVRWTGLQTGQSRVPPTGKEGQGQPEE
ncbi:MAG: hypothetical protein JW797_13200 [Bradymonadales bacterium]|nr:hypothetical protein [Bradymonadales bacterium]